MINCFLSSIFDKKFIGLIYWLHISIQNCIVICYAIMNFVLVKQIKLPRYERKMIKKKLCSGFLIFKQWFLWNLYLPALLALRWDIINALPKVLKSARFSPSKKYKFNEVSGKCCLSGRRSLVCPGRSMWTFFQFFSVFLIKLLNWTGLISTWHVLV